jgi:hypothetical protein
MEQRPDGRAKIAEPLEKEVSHVLEEARMIVPGIQALFGFQLIAVYNATFLDRLGHSLQVVHLVSICWIALAMGLVMTPAAYHRQAERGWVTARLAHVASRLLQAALVCLAVGVCLDVYLIATMVLGDVTPALIVASGVGAALGGLWFAYPYVMARRHPLPQRESSAPYEQRDGRAGHGA